MQRGDEPAFAALVRPELELAFRLAYVITGTAVDAEDSVQDALFKTWRSFAHFRAGERFRPWFLRIVANEARNRRRATGRRQRLSLRAAQERPPETADSSGLLDALNELPADARVVLLCRYVLGLTEQETGAALDVAVGTVKSRASRALEQLRESYD